MNDINTTKKAILEIAYQIGKQKHGSHKPLMDEASKIDFSDFGEVLQAWSILSAKYHTWELFGMFMEEPISETNPAEHFAAYAWLINEHKHDDGAVSAIGSQAILLAIQYYESLQDQIEYSELFMKMLQSKKQAA